MRVYRSRVGLRIQKISGYPCTSHRVCGAYSPQPRIELYCFRPSFNTSKLGYESEQFRKMMPAGFLLDLGCSLTLNVSGIGVGEFP